MSEKRYAATIGMCILPANVNSVSDFGLRYGKLHYADMVGLEATFAKHKDAILAAMEPFIQDLIGMGMAQALSEEPDRTQAMIDLMAGGRSKSTNPSR